MTSAFQVFFRSAFSLFSFLPVVALILCQGGCTLFSRHNDDKIETSEKREVSIEAKELFELQDSLLNDDIDTFLDKWQSTFAKPSMKVYLYEGLLMKAEAYHRSGDFEQMKEILIDLRQRSRNRFDMIYARATILLVDAYEGLNMDAEALATLLDIEQNLAQQHSRDRDLDLEASFFYRVEVPAKISIIYRQHNQPSEAKKYLELAQKQLERMEKRQDALPELPRVYYAMGAVNFDLAADNDDRFEIELDTLCSSQGFLVKSMDLNHNHWSKKSRQRLEKNYLNLLQYLENQTKDLTMDPFVREDLIQRTKASLNCLGKVDAFYKITSSETKPDLSAFLKFRDEIKDKLLVILNQLLRISRG